MLTTNRHESTRIQLIREDLCNGFDFAHNGVCRKECCREKSRLAKAFGCARSPRRSLSDAENRFIIRVYSWLRLLRWASNKGTLRAFRNVDRFTTFKIFRRSGALRRRLVPGQSRRSNRIGWPQWRRQINLVCAPPR